MTSHSIKIVGLGAVVVLALVSGCGASEGSPAGSESQAPASDIAPTGGDPADPASAGDVGDENAMSQGDIGDDTSDGVIVEDDDRTTIDGDSLLVGALDDGSVPEGTLPQEALAASVATTTANLNLRSGPGTNYKVLKVIPKGSTVTLVSTTKKNAFYNVRWNGTTGWSHSSYLKAGSAPPPPKPVDPNGAPSVDNAMARGRLSNGFSYWWGGGAWLASGVSSSTRGSCRGSCPSCSHSGHYGADCSGMVAKAWQFGTKALNVNSHPYSTASFVRDAAGKWRTVSRGALHRADALVYNSGGGGHIVLWEKGDGWGSSTVYECKGCSYGCVHDTRTFSSAYHGIRRAGF